MKKHAARIVGTFAVFCFLYFLYTYRGEALMLIGGMTFGNKNPAVYSLPVANLAYAAASRMNPPLPFSHYQRGRIAFIKGDFEAALYHLNQELLAYPEHTKAYYMLGLTLGYSGKEQEGIEMFSRYIENTNDTWASYNDKAWLQFRIGDIDGALATIEKVALAQPHNPWIANTYGVLLMNKGRYEEAESSLLKGEERLSTMTEHEWGQAYPGNDPRIYAEGLAAMKQSYEENLRLVREKMNTR